MAIFQTYPILDAGFGKALVLIVPSRDKTSLDAPSGGSNWMCRNDVAHWTSTESPEDTYITYTHIMNTHMYIYIYISMYIQNEYTVYIYE